MSKDKNMPFLDHLEELRWRLVRSAGLILVFAVVIWLFQEWIMEHVFLSMSNPDFITFRLLCDYFGMCVDEIPVSMQSMTVSGQFSYALLMSIMGGFVISFPFVFYQIWGFIRPGLKATEKRTVNGLTFYVSILFFTGILFGYFIVSPLAIKFFGSYQISDQIQNIFTINSYMSTIISTVFYCGLFFLLPIISYLLTKIGLITPAFLKKYRKHSVVGVLVLSAVITPPDVISQVIVAIPIVILYEIGIWASIIVHRKMNP